MGHAEGLLTISQLAATSVAETATCGIAPAVVKKQLVAR